MTQIYASSPIKSKNVKIKSRFWTGIRHKNKTKILPAIYRVYEETGRIKSFKHDWKEGDPYKPHIFWDSDVAKWMETAAYILGEEQDSDTEEKMERLIDLIEKNQEPSGYFNSYFQTVAPDQKWKNIHDHELYCIGHLLEAAVAYYESTGKDRFLKVMEKSVDHIIQVFMEENSAGFQYPGHEEIELALYKLYRVTGKEKYRKLAEHFLYRRGRQYEQEQDDNYRLRGIQEHLPVEKQKEAVGHAVRAAYLYTAMTDMAILNNDEALWNTVSELWEDITNRKMFVTGGVGTSFSGEAYTYPYDLPNEYGYTETCASIGLIFMAARMMRYDLNAEYADVVERALYNTVLGCVSEEGNEFFYSNPLEVDPALDGYLKTLIKYNMANRERIIPSTTRRKDLGCMCCPANVTRLLASIGEYIASESDDSIAIHMPVGCNMNVDEGVLSVDSDYPIKSDFTLRLQLNKLFRRKLYIRIPSWCKLSKVTVNGEKYPFERHKLNGYLVFEQGFDRDTVIRIESEMKPMLVKCHPAVKNAAGKTAVQRGPFVYCLEEKDNGPMLYNAYIDKTTVFEEIFDEPISEPVPVLKCKGKTMKQKDNRLYFTDDYEYVDRDLTFIPFYARLNRGIGEMIVWVNEFNKFIK
jgi:DUF1680 family protein